MSRDKKGAKLDKPTPIVKKIVKAKAAHHGGSWKIAYADFVTAMMAFFLLMWLLGSTSQGDLQGIADYFKNPMKVSLSGGTGAGDSSSVIKGGGRDLTRRDSQRQRGEIDSDPKIVNLKAAEAEFERIEMAQMRNLKMRLEKVIEANKVLRDYRQQMLIDITSEGLRIQLVDAQNRPMFASGRAELLPHMREILQELGRSLNDVPNRILLAGHTDAAPYSAGEKAYSNWELSSDRANASRRQLVTAGINEGKIVRVVGLASSVLFDKSDPLNPVNRRISIIILNKKTEESMLKDPVALPASAEAEPAARPAPAAASPATAPAPAATAPTATPAPASPPARAAVPAGTPIASR